MAFEIQVADRLAYGFLDDAARDLFINALGRRLADHMQENLSDLDGPRNYRDAFIAMLNERLSGYATLSFEDGEPGFEDGGKGEVGDLQTWITA